MDTKDQFKPATTPSGGGSEVHACRRCGWPFQGSNPSSKDRRAHKRICGTVEGYTDTKLIVDDQAVYDDEEYSGSISDDEHNSRDEEKEKTPSPKIEKRIIKESGSSDMFSAATDFSDTGISPGVTSDVKKVDEKSELFESPITHSKDADKVQKNDAKHSVPLVEHHYGSHKHKVIDQMEFSDTVQDQREDVHADKAETLLEDLFEVKTVQENVHESQTFDHEESAYGENIVTENLREAEAEIDKHPVMSFGELIDAQVKQAEFYHSFPKDGVKVGSSETVLGEGSYKVLTGQDSGVGASFCSNSNSLEGIWGSVSDISDVFGKSERRLERLNALKGPTLVESEEEIFEKKDSEVNVKKSQSDDSIAKVTNWSTSGHIATGPLRKLMSGANSPISKPSSSLIKTYEEAGTSSQPGKSNVTQEPPEVNQESSPVIESGDGKLVKKKNKVMSTLWKYVCCSASLTK